MKNIFLYFLLIGNIKDKESVKQLFRTVRIEKMTVNSSPYAVPIYHKLGFKETDSEQIVNGLRYIPMILS